MRKFNMIDNAIRQLEGTISVHKEALDEYMECYIKGDDSYLQEAEQVADELGVMREALAVLRSYQVKKGDK